MEGEVRPIWEGRLSSQVLTAAADVLYAMSATLEGFNSKIQVVAADEIRRRNILRGVAKLWSSSASASIGKCKHRNNARDLALRKTSSAPKRSLDAKVRSKLLDSQDGPTCCVTTPSHARTPSDSFPCRPALSRNETPCMIPGARESVMTSNIISLRLSNHTRAIAPKKLALLGILTLIPPIMGTFERSTVTIGHKEYIGG